MHKPTFPVLIFISLALYSCGKKPLPAAVPSPTAEAIAAFAEASYNGNAQNVADALNAGMPVDQKEKNGNSALMLASFNGHTEAIKILLDAGADVNLRDAQGRTPLMFAASGPYPAAVRLLIERGADLHAVDTADRFNALMFAAAEGLSPVVDILLAAGADPKVKDKDNDTAANFARQRGFTALADKLQTLIDAP